MTLTLQDLAEEMERGRIYECSLRDPHWHLDGLQDGESVFVDPRPSIILTLLHELTHRRHRRWSERRVRDESRRLLSRMDEAAIAVWWRRYQRIKRKGRPVEVEE